MWRLPRAVPRGIALELIATGALLDAARAQALGLLNRVVPPGQALAAALAVAEQVAANVPLAVAESLAIARDTLNASDDVLWQRSREAAHRIAASEDAREGPRAFAEHRAPRWLGR